MTLSSNHDGLEKELLLGMTVESGVFPTAFRQKVLGSKLHQS